MANIVSIKWGQGGVTVQLSPIQFTVAIDHKIVQNLDFATVSLFPGSMACRESG